MSSIIYKIVSRDIWENAQKVGAFEGAEIDLADGYIHFSSAQQVRRTAARFFEGRDNLLLVGVNADTLGEALRWEPISDGTLFPHLYGALSLSSVVSEDELTLMESGEHQFPDFVPVD